MFTIYENEYGGRLGNALFRYFACVLLAIKFGYQYTIEKKRPAHILSHEQFLKYINCKLSPPKTNLIMSEFFQMDEVYTKYKDQILEYIESNKLSHTIFTDRTDNQKRYQLSELIDIHDDFDKFYDLVIHVRLEDFVKIGEYISTDKLINLFNGMDFNEKSIAIVLNKTTTTFETNYVNTLLEWFEVHNIDVKMESNDIITDFCIMKNAKILVCSKSTISWAAAFLSKNIQLCYMPNYPIKKDRIYQTFKHPIKNTVLYDI